MAEKLALEKFENAPAPGLGGFLQGMVGLALPGEEDLESPLERDEAMWRARNDEDARLRADSEKIDQDETIWLYAHLTRRGEHDLRRAPPVGVPETGGRQSAAGAGRLVSKSGGLRGRADFGVTCLA